MEELTLVTEKPEPYIGMLEFMRMMGELAPEASVCVPWTDLIQKREHFMSERYRDNLDVLTRELEKQEYIRFVRQKDGKTQICALEKGQQFIQRADNRFGV